jgi:hypothetical protein
MRVFSVMEHQLPHIDEFNHGLLHVVAHVCRVRVYIESCAKNESVEEYEEGVGVSNFFCCFQFRTLSRNKKNTTKKKTEFQLQSQIPRTKK